MHEARFLCEKIFIIPALDKLGPGAFWQSRAGRQKKKPLGFPGDEPPPISKRNHPPTALAAQASPCLYVVCEVPVNCHDLISFSLHFYYSRL